MCVLFAAWDHGGKPVPPDQYPRHRPQPALLLERARRRHRGGRLQLGQAPIIRSLSLLATLPVPMDTTNTSPW